MFKMIIGDDECDTVIDFCYLGDVVGQTGGCTDAVTARIRSAWKSFHELLPILTNRSIHFSQRGNIFEKCVRNVLLYGSETWPLLKEDLYHLKRTERAMIRWICEVKLKQLHSTNDLKSRESLT